jgi:hypothetical protein
MAYTITINRKCDRCPRVEQTETTAEEVVRLAKAPPDQHPKALVVSSGGKPLVEFGFLCGVCQVIVDRYLGHAAKRPKHQSSLRSDARIEVEDEDE